MLKKLVMIGLAASIGFGPIVLAPMTAQAADAPAASASAPATAAASAKPAKPKKLKKIKKDDASAKATAPTK